MNKVKEVFSSIKKLDTKETYLEAIDIMNNYFSNWLNAGDYDFVDTLIKEFIVIDFSLSLNLNLLLLTLKQKSKIDKSGDGRITLFYVTKGMCSEKFSEEEAKSYNYLK